MLKIIDCSRKTHHTFFKFLIGKRTFLSEAYRCDEAWNARLKTPILQKVDPENLYLHLDHKFTTTGKVSAIDIDIFANTVTDQYQKEELLYLVHNLRLSAEASNILESTHHAVIRYLLDTDQTEELVDILHNRLGYGIFPDHLCYNILMDTYIKKEDYTNAAKIAVLPTLQEDTDNPITNALSLYSCHKYLENPDSWKKLEETTEDTSEEVKVRVKYLRNPYFDDHFDLKEPSALVGKTLAFQGKFMNNALGRTCQLRGLVLYKKYQDAMNLIKQLENESEEVILYEEVFPMIEKLAESIPKEQSSAELESIVAKLNTLKGRNTCKDSLTDALENNVKSAVNAQAEIDINEQLKKYSEWAKQREIVLNKQLEEINRQARIENIKKIKKDLQQQEKYLTFYQNEEEIELAVEELAAKDKKEMDRLLSMRRAETKLKRLKEQEEAEKSA